MSLEVFPYCHVFPILQVIKLFICIIKVAVEKIVIEFSFISLVSILFLCTEIIKEVPV